jgi:RNA polymerase sigma-70 factor (ECF subfamily)
MLGSVTDAEDVVQEGFLRMHRNPAGATAPEALAVTVITRLAIDHLRSARVRRERYVGTWLPEPVLTDGDQVDPLGRAQMTETVSMAFLVVLERLSPVERAVFLLRDVFDYDYDAIASITGKTEQNCRQILVRARTHLRTERPRFEVSREHRDTLARRFFAACRDGDLAGLEKVLADDVVFYADGAGKPPAITKPVTGRTQVARFVLGLMRQAGATGLHIEPVEVNGQPGAQVVDDHANLQAVFALHIADGHVQAVHNVMNPDKLNHLRYRL